MLIHSNAEASWQEEHKPEREDDAETEAAHQELETADKEPGNSAEYRILGHKPSRPSQLEMVAWLDIFLHHADPAAVSPVIIGRRCAATAGPAELVSAEAARHMVAPHVLLYAALAAGAEADSVFVLNEPGTVLLAHSFVTAHIFSMPRLFALEADFSSALRASQLFRVFVRSTHMRLTAGLGAPAH